MAEKKGVLSANESFFTEEMFGENVFCDVSEEFTLPEYEPEIKKILRVSARVLPAGKYVGGGRAELDPGYEYLYDAVYGTKALVFSNSREETEYVTATLRQIAKKRSDKDIFLIHHGNLSASLREDAEEKMKDETVTEAVTCATVTMEL